MSFSNFGLHHNLIRGVEQLGFKEPTSIQRDAIPAAIKGHDLLACSMTGSGKTAAFALPILNRLVTKNRRVTRALILTPTRELAAQIDEHFAALAIHTDIRSAAVYGGVGMGNQKRAFQDGVDVIVATPGRLLDHFQSAYARLHGLEVLVLDEADRMLDMGFLPDIRRIIQQLPKNRQTLFFSATMPREIVTLTREILKDPVTVNIDRQAMPATGITQSLYPVPQHLKMQLLLELVKQDVVKNMLVFTRTKHRADRVQRFLVKSGIPAGVIHGDRSQSQRTHALEGFKHNRYRILVATDVAARGIDVEALSHVLNFDVPGQPEDYIHRVGRTARAAATGDAFTFYCPQEEREVRAIERAIGRKLPQVKLPEFDYTQAAAEGTREDRGAGGRQNGGWRGQRRYGAPSGDRKNGGQRKESFGRPTRPWERGNREGSSGGGGESRPWFKRGNKKKVYAGS